MSGWMNDDPMKSSQDDLKDLDDLARLLKNPEGPKTPPIKAQFAPHSSPYIKESPAEITPGRLTPLQLSPLAHDLVQVKQEGQQSQQENIPTTSPDNPRKRRGKYEDEDPEEYSKRARKAAREPENRRTRQACDRCRYRRFRCDSNAQGCTPCVNDHMPCQVTDRVTAETFVRGEAGRLKAANEELEKKVKALADENTELVKQNEHLQQQLFQQPFQAQDMQLQQMLQPQQGLYSTDPSSHLPCNCLKFGREFCMVHYLEDAPN